MIWTLMSAIAIISHVTGSAGASDALILVKDGEAKSVIVIADKPSEAASLGASELQSWLRKITGVTVQIVPEGQLDQDSSESLILVGDTKLTAELGLSSDSFDLEEIRIRTHGNNLILIGDDRRPNGMTLFGTLWAVESFAEQFLGVRMLWPGQLGEVAPKRDTVEVGHIDLKKVPVLRQRRIRNIGYGERTQTGLDKLGWNAGDFKRLRADSGHWFQFHRIGGSFKGGYGHAYGNYWERFHQDHPEWFALQPDGTRDNSRAQGGHRARLCVSNQDLIEQVARDKIAALRANPTVDTVSISPNDGSRATFCMCDECESWDAPDGQMVEIWSPDGPVPHVSLTDRYVKFYSAIAGIVSKEFPDRYLGAYAYSAYRLPPVNVKLHPNLVIGFVGFSYLNEDARQEARESWLQWSKAAKQLFLRPNLLMAGLGFPTIYVHRLAEDLRFCAENGMLFTDFDCCYHNWATDGLNYYVLAKLLWDQDADVDDIIADYCRAGFDSAAEPVREYFRHIEDMTTDLANTNEYLGRKRNPEFLASQYTDEFLKECHALLDEAERKAGDDETVIKRIDFLRAPLDYVRIRRDWEIARANRKQDPEAAKRIKELEAERYEWYQKLGISWALNAARLQFYGY